MVAMRGRGTEPCGQRQYHPAVVALLDPVQIGSRVARNRVLFGPHVTNLGDGRAFSRRHVAYYRRRTQGGCGVIVVEEASVHGSDWPYERAPLAERAADGWHAVAEAVQDGGALVLAALGHAGGQGSSAYNQSPLWAPSRVPDVVTREVPKAMELEDIAAVTDAFASSAKLAAEAGCDGVEVNAGQHSLLRQFLSGLTNQRTDEYGVDRLRFTRELLAAVRRAIGCDRILGLRLSCDELAPWAGFTPEQAPETAKALTHGVDYVVVVRGSIYSVEKTRPDFHEASGFNLGVCAAVRAAISPEVAVVLQGSVIDPAMAAEAVDSGVADLVEMTRALIADPDLVRRMAGDIPGRPRPCLRCNQSCQVRDVRNPIVTCVGEPTSGHETEDPDWYSAAPERRRITIVGAGPAGLECGRIAASRGHDVRIVERRNHPGGLAALAGPGLPLVEWLVEECERLGVAIDLGIDVDAAALASLSDGADAVVLATGGRPGEPTFAVDEGALVIPVEQLVDGATLPDGQIAIWDPIGGPIAVAAAEILGGRAILITPDQIAGNELSRTGDLAPANVRLQQAGVRLERRSILRRVGPGEVEIEQRFSGERTNLAAAALVDAGYRLPDDALVMSSGRPPLRAGDCVAPRTLHEAILEGRRAALAAEEGW